MYGQQVHYPPSHFRVAKLFNSDSLRACGSGSAIDTLSWACLLPRRERLSSR